MNSILGKWIKKRNKSDFVVLILLGVMVMIVAMPTGAKQSQKETQTQEQKEQQLQTEDSYKEQLQQQLRLTYLFSTHDLSTVRRIAHSVTVLRGGQVVEQGDVGTLFASPQNDYTRELIDAIPHFSPATEEFA